jgi:hypothetical protein
MNIYIFHLLIIGDKSEVVYQNKICMGSYFEI